MEAKKAAFSLADLQQGAKKLATVAEPEAAKKTESKDDAAAAAAALESLEQLWGKHGGDLDLIFGELKANPAKAKKPHHAPKNAREFATRFVEGYYSVIDGSSDDVAAESKSHK
jgi:hypothetical protein